MVKLSGSISRKVPIDGIAYSSQQFGAAMEIEVSDADKPEAIQGRIRELYTLLSAAIDEQIAGAQNNQPNGNGQQQQAPPPPPRRFQPAQNSQPANRVGNGRNTTNGGNGRKTTATEAQQRAIFAICKSLGLDMKAVLADYNVSDASQLPIKTASDIIDSLKAQQNASNPRQ